MDTYIPIDVLCGFRSTMPAGSSMQVVVALKARRNDFVALQASHPGVTLIVQPPP